MFKVCENKIVYTQNPTDAVVYTNRMDKAYTKYPKSLRRFWQHTTFFNYKVIATEDSHQPEHHSIAS